MVAMILRQIVPMMTYEKVRACYYVKGSFCRLSRNEMAMVVMNGS